MLNYGGSITSAFPNSFCSSPTSLTCHLCNVIINEFENNYQNSSKVEKCTHCGINICEKCFNENQEFLPTKIQNQDLLTHNLASASHYNTVKKEFKQIYNYSKDIVEKLHLLNNAIKIEESAVSELNLIKHQVNTRALELIKQINQEKTDLIEQIEKIKQKYESTLNDRKEYYALSMQYKDELRKIIKKYKEFKMDENCSLNDLLKMYFSVKIISKNLDDYDHIKLITEQDPLLVTFEDRPTYRNLIGKLILNHVPNLLFHHENYNPKDEFIRSKEIKNRHSIQSECFDQLVDVNNSKRHSKIHLSKSKQSNKHNNKNEFLSPIDIKNNSKLSKDLSRSFSLNDLLSVAAKDFGINQEKNINQAITNLQLNLKKINSANNNYIDSDSNFETKENIRNESHAFSNNNEVYGNIDQKILEESKFDQSRQNVIETQSSSLNKNDSLNLPYMPIQSILKNSLNSINLTNNKSFSMFEINLNSNEAIISPELICKIMDQYKFKEIPKQRLEIDILPSHLCCFKNKLLIASSFGKIRIIDLLTYKIQKDELKHLLINGICLPKTNDPDNQVLYAITNGEIPQQEDKLNVSNACIIVSKRELKVLKKEINNSNLEYVFNNPSGICYDMFGNIYICDSGFNRVKVFDLNFVLIYTIETAKNDQDRLFQPKSVTTHHNMLYICDSANHRIVSYYILKEGKEFQFKSSYGQGYGDGPGMLSYPLECCVDKYGILSVRDHHNNRVQLYGIDCQPFHSIEVNAQCETIYSMTVADNAQIYIAKMVHTSETDQSGQTNTTNKYYIDIY